MIDSESENDVFCRGPKHEGKQQLVILHPMRLVVYSLQIVDGIAEHGSQSKLSMCFEHKFSKFAFSVCCGHFGGHKNREFFCVTHMDGTLTVFEQDGISYECVLNGERNIPSVMVYNNRTDSFLSVSAAGDLESFL